MKNAVDSKYSPNRFELLNCKTTKYDKNDHYYHKDSSIVGSDTISHHFRYKPSKRPEVIVSRFPENQHTFQKKCTVPGEKHIEKLSKGKLILSALIMLLLLEIVLSVLTETSNPNLTRLLDPDRQDINTSQKLLQKSCFATLTLI